MSGFAIAGAAIGALATSFGPLLVIPRSIGPGDLAFSSETPSSSFGGDSSDPSTDAASLPTLFPDCAVEEYHLDQITITDHPVEQGAAISDHAYRQPSEVILRWSWSNSSQAFDQTYVTFIYQALQQLQVSRQPLDLVTGKRAYQNMLIQSLATTTDKQTVWTLNIVARCKEVIIVQTQATQVPQNLQPQNQANPQDTTPPQNNGPVQPQGVGTQSESVLSKTAGALGF